jgi:hypothetical protein
VKTRVFYVAGICLLAALAGRAFWLSLRDTVAENPGLYAAMSPAERQAEYEWFMREFDNPRLDLGSYFETMKRVETLQGAYKRAQMAQNDKTWVPSEDAHRATTLSIFGNQYVHKVLPHLPQGEPFEQARDAAGYSSQALRERNAPVDPRAPFAWAMFYFAGLGFTFVHFALRIRALDGIWWMAALSDWRFPFWLMCFPVGLFKYPRAVDVKLQLVRAYRFAALVLTSCLSFAAAGCAGKRVKTEPDLPADAAKTWRIDADTVTWPNYLGLDGAVFHPGPVQQSSVTISLPRGFYLGAWNSVPLGDTLASPNFGHETDVSAGWNGSWLGLDWNTDATWIGVTPLAQYRGDVMQFSVRASRGFRIRGQTLAPFLWVRYATPVQGDTPARGIFFHEGVGWKWQKGRLDGSLNGELMYDSGAFGFQPGFFGKAGASLGFRLSDRWKVEIPIQASVPLVRTTDGRRTERRIGFRIAFAQ